MPSLFEDILVLCSPGMLYINKRPIGLTAPPFIIVFLLRQLTKSQFRYCSNEVIYGHYSPKCIWKVDQRWNQVKLESAQTLLKIIHLASRKSYLVIIFPNSHDKLTKIKLGQVGVGSNIVQNHSSNLLYEVLSGHCLPPSTHAKLTKIKIR